MGGQSFLPTIKLIYDGGQRLCPPTNISWYGIKRYPQNPLKSGILYSARNKLNFSNEDGGQKKDFAHPT